MAKNLKMRSYMNISRLDRLWPVSYMIPNDPKKGQTKIFVKFEGTTAEFDIQSKFNDLLSLTVKVGPDMWFSFSEWVRRNKT